VGARVGFTFRRLFTAGDVHDYFWKARLVDAGSEEA
jgi:hydroxymethylglutaryl-CoA synthase